MDTSISAPLLSRIKSWQLVGLGLSGWCTLYSVAILTWGASSALIGNAQGGCFAATMTLAGIEARRFRKVVVADPLQWASGVPTEHLNQTIASAMQKREFRIEANQKQDGALGFGVRAVNAGRTLVFETERWMEPVIDLQHAQTTEANRRKASADLAIIVGAGKPDAAAEQFVQTVPVQFLVGRELEILLQSEKPANKKA